MTQKFYIIKKGCNRGKQGECWIDLYENFTFRFASFENFGQAKKFFDLFKLKVSPYQSGEYMDIWECDKIIKDAGLFWDLNELPKNAKKIKALSNGSIVDCYYKKTKKEILFYRPNPNAKNVYNPLKIDEHIKYQKENGIY